MVEITYTDELIIYETDALRPPLGARFARQHSLVEQPDGTVRDMGVIARTIVTRGYLDRLADHDGTS